MNQFKKIFLGLEKPDHPRVANSQKCIRVSGKHNDLEEVGKDTYHHTFFEMLGNWSFGDYYKKEAIEFAWELLTEVWKLPKKQLWATVFQEDDEAETLWKQVTDIDPSHVLRFGEDENFWEMGETGPCGPCSEIHMDLGEAFCNQKGDPQHRCEVNGGCGRFIELWNLVFIQFNRKEDGTLEELPDKHVDTGMGFERIVAILQGVYSNYATDLFAPLIARINELTGVEYPGPDGGMAHRVIADHIRTLSFAIADGVIPSNEGRGYVLRRILRRAARYGRTLGMREPFIYKLVPVLVDVMGDAYPEIMEKNQYIAMVIKSEEENFGNTLDRGIEIFERITADLSRQNQRIIPGFAVFRLYDTYGFPVDLTRLMAAEKGMEVDMEGFEQEMERQRQRAKEAHQFRLDIEKILPAQPGPEGKEVRHSEFVGYESLEADVRIVGYHQNKFLLDKTPFYGEAGGQVGDTGVVYQPERLPDEGLPPDRAGDEGGFEVRVTDTLRVGEQIIHIGEIVRGGFDRVEGKLLKARVDARRRKSIARNHTATHLLHKALKEVLGEHVHQAGSLVAPDRLRFDLTHFEKITPDQLDEIERRVNERIRQDLPVEVFHTSFEEARKMGAIALFGEKYGEVVRVVRIGDYSMELCGGTHLERTGEIGYFRIVSETGVAAGVRRIEAVTGEGADELLRREKKYLQRLSERLNVRPEDLPARVEELLEERRRLEREVQEMRLEVMRHQLDQLVEKAPVIDGWKILSTRVESRDVEEMKRIGDELRIKLRSGVGVIGSVINGKALLLCIVTDDLIREKNLQAGVIVRELAKYIGGGGGGGPRMAQAGGRDVQKLDLALQKAVEVVKGLISR